MVSAALQHRVRTAIVACMAIGAAGCEFGKTVVASPRPTAVVHAVLNPDAAEQVILLEESLTGRVTIDDSVALNPNDPIVSAGGQPITGATVELGRTDTLARVIASESTILVNGVARGTGRYVVPRSALVIAPGVRYALRIATGDGRTINGETTVPGPLPGWTPGAGSTSLDVLFNRSTDTLRLFWPAVPNTRTFAIRIDTPNGPWFLFSDSTRFDLAGSLRNFFADGLPSVWYPGFRQAASVHAVDKNFYDYYRSGNDPFGGTGLISSVQGGLGLFGSLMPQVTRGVEVRQTPQAPLDARWSGTNPAGMAAALDLWLETPGPTISSVSGRVVLPSVQFVLGTLKGATLRLAVIDPVARDTVGVFNGTLFADSISGTFANGFPIAGPRTWRRTGPPSLR
jgi:hypothetical protein